MARQDKCNCPVCRRQREENRRLDKYKPQRSCKGEEVEEHILSVRTGRGIQIGYGCYWKHGLPACP